MTPERREEVERILREYPDGPGGDVLTLRWVVQECLAEIGAYERTQKTLLRGLDDLAALAKHLGEIQGIKVDPHPAGVPEMRGLRDWRLETKG